MGQLVIEIGAVIAAFAGGVALGASHSPTVDKAIAHLKAAEQSAKNTLDKIANHKAS